jgi:transcriptional regulator with XRE-family HTH domain
MATEDAVMPLRPGKLHGDRAKQLAACVGNNVRALRERLGITQTDFAREASIERTVLNKIENGARAVTLVTLSRLAVALHVEAWTLLRPKARRGAKLNRAKSRPRRGR